MFDVGCLRVKVINTSYIMCGVFKIRTTIKKGPMKLKNHILRYTLVTFVPDQKASNIIYVLK